MQQWINTPSSNRGVLFKQVSESTNNVLYFYSNSAQNASTKKPYLNVTYTTHPAFNSLAMTPCDSVCDPDERSTTSLTPTLTVNVSDPDSSPLTYTWQVHDYFTGAVVTSGTTTAASGAPTSWPVASGVLSNESLYEFRVAASDGTTNTWSDWQPFTVHADVAPDAPSDVGFSPCLNDDCSLATTTSTRPTLTAVVTDSDDPSLTADIQIRNASTQAIVATGTSQVESGDIAYYSVPAGTLAQGTAYEVRAGGADASQETWGAWQPLSVQAGTGPPEPTSVSLQNCMSPCLGWVSSSATPTFSAAGSAGHPGDPGGQGHRPHLGRAGPAVDRRGTARGRRAQARSARS